MILEPNEQLLDTIGRHWFVLLVKLAPLIVLALLPPVAAIGLAVTPIELPFEITGERVWLAVFFYTIWLLVLWVGAFVRWTDYYLDVWYVTPERIVDVDQMGLFSRRVSSMRFERIQDVTSDVGGFIATFLDYGDIHVQSAGRQRHIVLKGAHHPVEHKVLIVQQLEKVMEEPETVRLDTSEEASDGEGGEKRKRTGKDAV